MSREAVVLGGTGLVGRALVDMLLADARWRSVTTLGRRPLDITSPRLVQRTLDLAALSDADVPAGAHAFCALGTTIRAAGSQAAFEAVDRGLVVRLARACAARGAASLHVVSAAGANADSRVFYNRVKGEMEREVAAAGVRCTFLYRPSLLLGPRTERRPMEAAAMRAARVLAPALPRAWRAIPAERVAAAMVARAAAPTPGFHVVGNAEMWRG